MNLYSSLLRKAILLTVALAAAGSSLSAATLQWTNSAGGLWTAATNWSPNQVPATGDAVVITNAGNYTVTNTATVALASLALGAGGDTNLAGLQILGVISGTLNVTNTAVESNGLLRVAGGTVAFRAATSLGPVELANGSLEFTAAATLATLTQSGGDLGGLGTVTVVNGAALSGGTQSDAGTTVLQGSSTLTGTWGADTGRTLRNEGTFTWSAGVLDLNPLYHAAAANNVPAGRFINTGTFLASGNALTLLRDTSHNIYDSNGKALFVNEGTFTRTGATNGHLLTLSTRYNNLGALHLENGRLAFLLSGAHTNGTFTAAAASASLEFTGGTHTTQAGALTGAGALLVNGATLTLAADTGLSPGSLTVSAGSLTVNGPRTYLNPVTVNGGTLNWADPATLQAPLLASGSLNFAATATLATLTQSGGDLGGLGTVTVVNGAALSGGTQSDAGTTVLQGSSTLTGTWGADTGRTLRNEGTFTWSAGVLDLNPLYHAAAANNVPAGRFINTGTFLASGNALTLLRDTSHNIYDSNGKALFVNEGTFTRTGATNGHLLTLSTRYNNLGALHLENGRLAFLLSGAHTNGTFTAAAASASLEFTGGTHTTQAGALTGAGALLVNGATLTLAADTGLSPGSLTVSAGSLTVNGPRTYLNPVTVNGGTLNWADPATLQAPLLASGSLNFAATATLATLTQSGGDLGGLGTVTVVNGAALSGGTQSDAGTTVLQGSSTLTGTWGADTGRTLRNEGTFTWSAGVLDLNPLYHAAAANNVPAGRFINTGTFLASGNALTLLRDTSHNIYDSNGKALFVNEGTFTRTGATNGHLLTLSTRYNNLGALHLENGRLAFLLSGAHTNGTFTAAAASASLEFTGGTHTTQAGALTGAGALLVNGATLTLAADTGLSPGSLTVSAGSLTVNGPRTYLNPVTVNGGTLNWADPATLQAPLLASGSLNFAATATLATLTQSGGDLGGLGTVTVVNGAALSGGTQSEAGTTVLQGSSTLTGTWGADTGRTLRNEGTFTWSAGVLDLNPLYHAAAANNVPAGRFINTGTFLASGNALTLLRDTSHNIYDSNGKALFVNEGTFTRTGATNGHLLTLSTRYNNLGALHLENGRLAFLLSGAHTNGTFTAAAASASLEFTGGTHTTQAGALTGAGALLVNGATLTLAADTGLSPGSLTVSAGSLTVNGPRTYLNPVTVNGGTLNWADPATLQAPLLASGSLNFAATATPRHAHPERRRPRRPRHGDGGQRRRPLRRHPERRRHDRPARQLDAHRHLGRRHRPHPPQRRHLHLVGRRARLEPPLPRRRRQQRPRRPLHQHRHFPRLWQRPHPPARHQPQHL
jgi:hypothetical protein